MSEIVKLKARIKELEEANDVLKRNAFVSMVAGSAEDKCCRLLSQIQKASTLKNNFMNSSGHDILTSLNSVIGALDVLYGFIDADEPLEYVDMAAAESVRLLKNVTRVLDVARIESGKIDIHSENFDLRETLDSDLYALSIEAHGREIEFSCDIEPGVPGLLRGDGRRLAQIVSGLVGDRVLYTRDEGAVAVNVSSDGYDEHNKMVVRFSVTDTGYPIGEVQLSELQEFMIDMPSGSQPLAAGDASLGLICSIQLVKIMGGTVGVESTEQGSTFWFSLAFDNVVEEREEAEEIYEMKRPFSVLQEKKILLAEDDTVNRILITKMLEQQGVSVVAANDGMQAFECAKEETFDLALMDIQMPVLDGFGATKKIRELEKGTGAYTKIIALTAIADREKCLQAGMDDYLAKPIQKNVFLDMLTEHLTRSALIVDDDSEVVQILIRSLVVNGWRVNTAETGRQALYEASLNHFDAIFLNTSLPDFQGNPVAEVIRKLDRFSGNYSTLIGLSNPGDDVAHAQKEYFDLVMERPLSIESVQTTLCSLFDVSDSPQSLQ